MLTRIFAYIMKNCACSASGITVVKGLSVLKLILVKQKSFKIIILILIFYEFIKYQVILVSTKITSSSVFICTRCATAVQYLYHDLSSGKNGAGAPLCAGTCQPPRERLGAKPYPPRFARSGYSEG